MDNAAKEWLDFAQTDLSVARHLFETNRPQPLDWAKACCTEPESGESAE